MDRVTRADWPPGLAERVPQQGNGDGRRANEDRPLRLLTAAQQQLGSGASVRDDAPPTLADLAMHRPDFAARVVVDPRSMCWRWTGYTDRDGYGRLGGALVHRVVYRLLVGPIPAERPQLDHVAEWGCTSRACCWPGHLEPVTPRVNVLRSRSWAAVNAAKTECIHGHPYDLVNTYWRPGTPDHRDCRACMAMRRHQRRYAGMDPLIPLAEVA